MTLEYEQLSKIADIAAKAVLALYHHKSQSCWTILNFAEDLLRMTGDDRIIDNRHAYLNQMKSILYRKRHEIPIFIPDSWCTDD